MKKLLFLIPLLCLFLLSSCDSEPEYIYDSITSTKEEETTNPSNNEENKPTTTNSSNIELDGDAPEDGESWTKLA